MCWSHFITPSLSLFSCLSNSFGDSVRCTVTARRLRRPLFLTDDGKLPQTRLYVFLLRGIKHSEGFDAHSRRTNIAVVVKTSAGGLSAECRESRPRLIREEEEERVSRWRCHSLGVTLTADKEWAACVSPCYRRDSAAAIDRNYFSSRTGPSDTHDQVFIQTFKRKLVRDMTRLHN